MTAGGPAGAHGDGIQIRDERFIEAMIGHVSYVHCEPAGDGALHVHIPLQ